MRFAHGGYLDAGSSSQLNLSSDVTIEVGVQLDDLSAPHGLITRGVLNDGSDDDVPYALWIETDGRIAFGFEDKAHGQHVFHSSSGAVLPGATTTMIAVSRRHVVQLTGDLANPSVGATWDEIQFFSNGVALGAAQRYPALLPLGGGSPRSAGVGASDRSTLIGRAYGSNAELMGLRGALSEVRLWNVARPAADIGARINGRETGLIAYWRLQDGSGSVASDSKGNKHAVLHGSTSWVHTPDPNGSVLTVYLDGSPVATTAPRAPLAAASPQFHIGALGNETPSEFFRGQLQDVRIWRVTRTAEQVRDNLFTRLTGGFADLVAYYPLSEGAAVVHHGLRGNGLNATTQDWVLSTAPLGTDIPMARNALLGPPTRYNGIVQSPPVAAEYAMLETDANGAKVGALKRAYSYIDAANHWNLVTGFMVGDLHTDWVGQVQFDPQLIGYIEGAPPVPSENLTVEDSYGGTSSISLVEATSTTYTYATTRDKGFDTSIEASAGWGEDVQAPQLGILTLEAPLGIGVGELVLAPPIVEVKVKGKAKTSFEMALSWLHDSSSGQGSVTTKSSSVALVGAKETEAAYPDIGPRFVPENKGFALVQSQTADVFALRLVHTGVLIAYQMSPNPDIPRDYNIITFQIDPSYVKQGVLDGKVGHSADATYPNALSYSPDISYFKPIEAYALKTQIERAQQEVSTLYQQTSVDPNDLAAMKTPDLPPALRRDFVNTYVWTADGGQFAETTSTVDTYSETVGGAYHFQGMGGAEISGEIDIWGANTSVELNAMFGGHLDLAISKSADSEKSFELDVSVVGEQMISTTDPRGKQTPITGKVDAYRWMTFYLTPQANHFDAFFNQVVDREWLMQSNEPGARALMQAEQTGKRPPAWRVLHRVTYVSRVLADTGSGPGLDQALAALDIRSNYELIRTLRPFVLGHTGSYGDFVSAVRVAVSTYLPNLNTPQHLDEIVKFLVLYYGVPPAPELSGA